MATAHVFPGQGAQFPGMAKPLYERSKTARNMLERANGILGFRITDIMFEGSEEELKATHVTQPAIFLHSVVLALCSGLERPDMVAIPSVNSPPWSSPAPCPSRTDSG